MRHHSDLPRFLILFVTSKCNYRCKHCFIDWKGIDGSAGPSDLSFEEIKGLADQLADLTSVSITGGEPFLRPDLVEIAELFVTQCGTSNLYIPTNGSVEDTTVSAVEQICRVTPAPNVGIGVSIDGLEATHNDIRGASSAFTKALSTAEALLKLSADFPNLSVGFVMTLCERNIDEAQPVADLLRARFPDVGVSFNLYRGHPIPELGMYLPSIDRIRKFFDYWNNELEKKAGHSIDQLATNAGRRFLAKKTLETLTRKKQVIKCFVGNMYLVVYSNGDTAFCESLPPFGNIRKATVKQLWHGQEAEKQRREIADGQCYCTHECFQPLNVAVNPGYYPEMAFSYLGHLLTGRGSKDK